MGVKDIIQKKRESDMGAFFGRTPNASPVLKEVVLEMWKAEMPEIFGKFSANALEKIDAAIGQMKSLAKGDQGYQGPPGPAGMNGKDGRTPSKQELAALAKAARIRPKDGKNPSKEEVYAMILELLPPDKKEKPDTELAKKLEALTEYIENGFKNLNRRISEKKGGGGNSGGGGGGDIINIVDLSALTTGALKTFTVPKHRKAIMVLGSDFPSVLFEGNGFTVSADKTQITLTVANAPSQGSQLGFQYVR